MSQQFDSNDELHHDDTPNEDSIVRTAVQQVARLTNLVNRLTERNALDQELLRKARRNLRVAVAAGLIGLVAGIFSIIGVVGHQDDISQLQNQSKQLSSVIQAQHDELIARCELGNERSTGTVNSLVRLTNLLAPDNKIGSAEKAVKQDYIKYVEAQNPKNDCAKAYPLPALPSSAAAESGQ